MGGISSSVSINAAKQKALANIAQSSEQTCSTTCQQIQSGNIVFLDGSNTGNITFDQSCTSEASCNMRQSIQSIVDILQDLAQSSTAAPSAFLGISTNIATNLTEQEQKVLIEQRLTSLCSATVDQQQNNNIVYARNSTTGDIAFEQAADAVAACYMENMAIAEVELTNSASQTAESGSVIGLGSIIAIVIVVIVILALVAYFTRVNKRRNSSNNRSSGRRRSNAFSA